MSKDKYSIHQRMARDYNLAVTYAEDGAFHSAARVLENLSTTVKAHALWCDAPLERMMARGKVR